MLVLSRKKNESIVINNDITVTIVEIRGEKVRVGIVAPKEVPVHRQEVYEAIHGEARSSLAPAVSPFSATLHPSEEMLAQYARSVTRVSGPPSDHLTTHLSECPSCCRSLGAAIAAIPP